MSILFKNPHQIYDFIDNTVNKILSDLDKKSENQAVQGSKERVLKIVSSFKNQTLDNAISELKKNSEWGKLVIAFYGETNAGKSILIEALRIYLGENVKIKNISKFNELKQKFSGLSVAETRQIQENKEVCEMIELADGAIIGDGRPDFTRKATSYEFDDFILIDLPGIEGSEEKVIGEILESVKRAHAVFYVTSSVTPPQKGEDNKKGTIEKIKEHLSDQSEVYVLFNKRINSHQQIKENLLNEGEQKSLLVIDEKMREIIGDSYASHKVVSAKVAFLSVAECLLEGSKADQDRAKFLDKFDRNELIKRSNLDEFGLFLQNELAENAQKKIKKSNFYKANNILKQLIDILKDILCNNILPLKEMLAREYQDAKNNINTAFLSLKNDANIAVDKEIEKFKKETRNSIYDYIDKDVSNDDFKRKLEYLLN